MNTNVSNASSSAVRTLGELFNVRDPKVSAIGFPVNPNPGPLCPEIEPSYEFQEDHVRRLLLWIGGVAGRTLLIHGPTGCGKSSLVEQLGARLGKELYRVPCHAKMEFSELTGQMTLLSDGSTKFVYGALPRAMSNGSVLLLDEINFMPGGVVGALNTVLDGGPLLLSETGELIRPHSDFRICATGNAIDRGDDSSLYKGTQSMNLALMQRFLALKADYLPVLEEAAMLNRAVSGLPAKVVEALAEVASDVRVAFKNGDIESTVSTRTLVKWAKVLQARSAVLFDRPEDEIKFALQFVLTDLLKPEDAKAIEGTLYRKTAGLVLARPGQPEPTASAVQPDSSTVGAAQGSSDRVVLDFLINPSDQTKTGAITYWAGVKPEAGQNGSVMNGMIHPMIQDRLTNDKSRLWFEKTLLSKKQVGFKFHVAVLVEPSKWDFVARQAARLIDGALNKRWIGGVPGQIMCVQPEPLELAIKIAEKLQIEDVKFVQA